MVERAILSVEPYRRSPLLPERAVPPPFWFIDETHWFRRDQPLTKTVDVVCRFRTPSRSDTSITKEINEFCATLRRIIRTNYAGDSTAMLMTLRYQSAL